MVSISKETLYAATINPKYANGLAILLHKMAGKGGLNIQEKSKGYIDMGDIESAELSDSDIG